ncbi:leucyl/phenylalanyl-tRNA--protein transferase [Weeksellaceae bacterium KMM 9713]|uniref:Leucyl/phenylalanyl-tRNA--protein transferase n=1 Tax=Profundicola chukchiensis TaxID=2961959 RepID=A0A9X4MUY0_9FLAO|nr:leucyl/phenylalanyl-tRNA--protein transferase [Profundicola chukchiensis]MDG4945278.1 leucyl/phenylalanyl-tRNA--protein transferase [Profundicola chukchiensis]
MIFLQDHQAFPPADQANKEGILAVSMNLSIVRLLEAYHKGIFPWYNADEPVLWWTPDPRMVLFPEELKISKSMRKVLRDEIFKVTYNQDFKAVIESCRDIPRAGQDGTWISDEIIAYYTHLFNLGWVQSVEVWNQEGDLVGGLYGVLVDRVFCGESMFAKESNASKAGFISFIQEFKNELDLIDCQIYTKHLASLGARLIPRKEYLKYLPKFEI